MPANNDLFYSRLPVNEIPLSDLLTEEFPLRARKQQQAAVRVLGQRHPSFCLSLQRVTIARRDGHPPLRIECQR